jgi:hypothetical protein
MGLRTTVHQTTCTHFSSWRAMSNKKRINGELLLLLLLLLLT